MININMADSVMCRGITYLVIVFHVLGVSLLPVDGSNSKNYCQHQTFRTECLDNQVVVMTHAEYGRMRLGDCIKTNFGYIGCSKDVLDRVHSRCSGRRDCEITIPDPELDETRPCNADLKSYLEVDYDCVNVTVPETATCPQNTTNNVTNTSGVFASIVTIETGCGNEFSPWTVLASPGQRINITLMVYGRKGLYGKAAVAPVSALDDPEEKPAPKSAEQILCQELAIIEEDEQKTALSSCEGTAGLDPGGKRFTSMGHNVTVYIRSRALDYDTHFIIKYEVDGCPDIEPNKFTWVTRDGDKVAVGCRASGLTWHMTCLGNVWHGEPGNCSAGEIKEPRREGDGTRLSIGTSVIIILVVSGVVGIIVLIVGLFCMKRYRARQAMHDMPMKDVRPLNQEDQYDEGMLYARNDAFQSGRTRIGKQKLKSKNKKNKGDHDYEYVWDMSGKAPPPPPTPDGTLQTSTCVVAGGRSGTPKSPRAVHDPASASDMCVCPEIHVHVHHSTENRLEGGQSQVSRVHIQARADHCGTMPRMAATISRTPVTRRRDDDFAAPSGTLRAIQAPPTPQRNRKPEPKKHGSSTMARYKSKDRSRQRQPATSPTDSTDGKGEKRYWTLPVGKSAFSKSKSAAATTPPDSNA